MKHQLRSITTNRPRAVLLAAVGIATTLLAAPAAAGCGPLDHLPRPDARDVSVIEVVQ